MNSLSRMASFLLLAATAPVIFCNGAAAQAPAVIPIPFSSIFAGEPAGSGYTTCANSIPDIDKLYVGDGCPATQAPIVSPQNVAVDAAGNVYILEYGSSGQAEDVRVVYKGGAALTAMLLVANSNIPNFSPVVGNIYTLVGGFGGAAITQKNGIFFCGNISNGVQGMDSQGDGCPSAQAQIQVRGIAIDPYNDLFLSNAGSYDNVRVVYGGGPAVAKLIAIENPGTVAQIGYIYKLTNTLTGYSGDGGLASAATFRQIVGMAIDSKGNIYGADYAPNGSIANYNIRRIDAVTGIITTFTGQNVCTTANGGPSTTCMFNGNYAYYDSGDGGPASQAGLDPIHLFFDANDNLYICSYVGAAAGGGGRIRVVYNSGTIPGITNPVPGYIYTYAGGMLTGYSTANGTKAANVRFGSLQGGGIDAAGNIYAIDTSNHIIWRFDANTSVGTIIAGGPSSTGAAQPGKFCNGVSGPVSLDNYGDGCPALQTYVTGVRAIAFDQQGNFYLGNNSLPMVQKFTYHNNFPATADGTPITQPMAFEATASTALTGDSFTVQGKASSEFTDAGGGTCTTPTTLSTSQLCTFNIGFNPAHPGVREGTISLNTASGAVVTETLNGEGLGSDIAIDTGTQTTLGSGLTPVGVATDLLGNVYVADTKGNQVLVGPSSGTALTPLITGLSKPKGVAVDSVGNIYVADSGNNRILETTSTGTTIASLGTGLSNPSGVAVDAYGNIYVADTGNNRIVHLNTSNYQYTIPSVTLTTALSGPTQLALDTAGDLYILDPGNSRILELSGGSMSGANFTTVTVDPGVVPGGVAVDASGTVYVADSSGLQILSYTPGAISGNVLLTGLGAPVGLASDADANLFVADTKSAGAIELRRSLGSFTFPLTNLNTNQTTTVGIDVNNVGNAALSFTMPITAISGTNASLYSVVPSTTSGCGAGSPVASATSCGLTASFTPVAVGLTTATVKFNTNAADNGTVAAILNGDGLRLAATTISLSYAPTPVNFDSTVTFTAALTPAVVTTTPTGTFSFQVDNQTPVKQVYSASAILQVPNLVVGPHSISVTYSGDTVYASSATTVNFTVNKAVTTTTLSQSTVNSSGQITLQLTATVSSTTANGETGSITFYAGTQALNATPIPLSSATVTTSGTVKTYTIKLGNQAVNFPNNNLTAVYTGDANFSGSTSSILTSTGDFIAVTANPSLTVSQGFVGNLYFTVNTLLGSAGTITVTCSGLPTNSLCRELPQSIPLTAATCVNIPGNCQTQIQVYTNIDPTLAVNQPPDVFKSKTLLVCGLPLGCLMLLFFRRRRFSSLLAMLIGMAWITAMSGCSQGGNFGQTNLTTPAGTYNLSLTFTGSAGLTTTHVIPVSLTVVAYVPPS